MPPPAILLVSLRVCLRSVLVHSGSIASAHIHFMLKTVIVGTSWILAYFALKNLPITIVTPTRASVHVGIGLIYSGSR